MMERKYDVVVVGAGPTGSTAARICAKSGLSTLLLEEQAHIGYPVQCAGLLSNHAFEECEVSSTSVMNTVSGADIRAGNAHCSFDAGKTMAYVVDRGILDREMAMNSADAGAEIQLKTIAKNISRTQHTITVSGLNGKEDISYSMLIAADGPRSVISRALGIPGAPVYLSGLQCDVNMEVIREQVHIFPNASPDFFAWIIPLDSDHARVGLCGVKDVRSRFFSFIHPYQDRCTHFVSGTIPLGLKSRTYDERILICGDAAAMAKPTSGGGVYTGCRSARHAADVAIKTIEQDNYTIPMMARYEKAWKKDFGHEIRKGFSLFNIRRQISPVEMEQLISTLSHEKIRDLIVSKGDMDRPSRLAAALMVNPRMLPAYSILMKAGIHSILNR